ncbi:hypothetical protein P5P86_16790 [Nocardioides sp. BP30]|uniref:hypothetical protein n=1 Tax=Nocardioides sp. BP30 TaxID=3036374 RepID=UPI0024689656|nr:hypothetical protein [Nocardioides sp. BP30]WGL51606.1 hypothetical protein P5P86_16790 [Nocardioides sp. BP30]
MNASAVTSDIRVLELPATQSAPGELWIQVLYSRGELMLDLPTVRRVVAERFPDVNLDDYRRRPVAYQPSDEPETGFHRSEWWVLTARR